MTRNSFFKQIYNRRYQSVWTCTLGKNQSGKTDFALFQMEILYKLGLADGFGSNIPDLKADFEIDFIEDFQTLKKRCQMLNPSPEKHGIKRYFFLGDEMGDWAPKDQPWLNVRFIKELQQVRKYGLCFLGCAIDRVDERILNEKHFHGVFHKISKADPTKAVYIDFTRGNKRTDLFNIPQTKIRFDTFHSASFYMEPQVPDNVIVPLNPQHEIVKKYLECGSWKKADIETKQGKRAVMAVLDYHMKHCLHSMHEPITNDDSMIPSTE